MQVQHQDALKYFMKIDFKNSIRRLSFLCRLPDIKIAWINPCWGIQWKDFKVKIIQKRNFWNQQNFIVLFWWQNIDPKQWIWWTSSLLSELIIKKQLSFHKSFFCQGYCFNFQFNWNSSFVKLQKYCIDFQSNLDTFFTFFCFTVHKWLIWI